MGQYGYSIKLTADWTTVNIPVDDLLPPSLFRNEQKQDGHGATELRC